MKFEAEETLRLTLGKVKCGRLICEIVGTDAQIQHVREAILRAAHEANALEGLEPKPCGCSGS